MLLNLLLLLRPAVCAAAAAAAAAAAVTLHGETADGRLSSFVFVFFVCFCVAASIRIL